MSRRVLCKYFAHGACLKGEYCEFSHDWTDPSNNVCTFYQKGRCAFGSRCRYDHVKVSHAESSASSNSQQPIVSESVSVTRPLLSSQPSTLPGSTGELAGSEISCLPPQDEPAWGGQSEHHPDDLDDWRDGETRTDGPSDIPICSFIAGGGVCPRGENCPHIHGDICPTCGKQCLHPFRTDEREEHMKACEKKQKHIEALKHSQDIECSVCLERVLSKSELGERKFGILSECDHPFCISCIRNWRNSSSTSGMDVNNALRACPICRKLSYFVIPSVIWYSSKEQKQEIVDSYKTRLRSIDCKHFNFGNGNCPFGSSCFYKHAYRDGQLEEVVLRHIGNQDGLTVIAKDIRLSDFLSDLHIR
ncbi:E3 ubiquitin-protein ligase makorin isoform X2 [Momordica charantia]|uniref:E3 ubiquitin-protein ligase makorin isoform X2 n=1 Tax=Momordica charantia TaxID=3673 RepID=A0A6J1D553_MOMCH|nr:E3 ubiquitin-protein ligase makorin isoform X2 [Momordica charantia]XP_022148815.1 E3 ubiquitin-protein ligase makorin isoform X2 [Momordica charantia]